MRGWPSTTPRRVPLRRARCRRCARRCRRTCRCSVRPNSRDRSTRVWTSHLRLTELGTLTPRAPPSIRRHTSDIGLYGACSGLARSTSRERAKPPSAHTAMRATSGDGSSSSARLRPPVRIAGVADGDQHIAHEAVAADALDGERGTARGTPHRRAAPARPAAAREVRRAPQLRLARGLREFVPRADRQAIVAAIDAVADQRRGSRAGYGPCARWSDRKCSAAHRAGRARERPRSGRRRGRRGRRRNDRLGCVGRQIQRGEDRAEKQPGAEIARHQIGVLALPAQPGRGGQRLFHHRRGVDEKLHVAASRARSIQRANLQPRLDHVVIIVARA